MSSKHYEQQRQPEAVMAVEAASAFGGTLLSGWQCSKASFYDEANSSSRCPPALNAEACSVHIARNHRMKCGTVPDCRTFTMFDLLAITQAFLVNVRLLQSFGRPSDPVSTQAVVGTHTSRPSTILRVCLAQMAPKVASRSKLGPSIALLAAGPKQLMQSPCAAL